VLILNWMSFPVRTVKPHDSVADARALLAEHRINQLVVTKGNQVVGIVTDRDLRDAPETAAVSASVAAGAGKAVLPDPGGIAVEDVMSANVMALRPQDSVEHAARLMVKERIGAVPIVEKGKLWGILTRSDILRAFLSIAASNGKSRGADKRASKSAPRAKPPRKPGSAARARVHARKA
jgi:acetoin utilization protein AcuB